MYLPMLLTMDTISISCYSGSSIALSSNTTVFLNLTFQACQCLLTQQNVSAVQYNTNDSSCYPFDNQPSQSDIRIKLISRVCFLNQSPLSTAVTLQTSTMLPTTVTTSASVTDNDWYTKETLYLNNTVVLTTLFIMITVPKNLGASSGVSSTTFWASAVNNIINETNTTIIYTFAMNSGQTIVVGQWQITAQFALNGQARSTSNDTYTIQTGTNQIISSHF